MRKFIRNAKALKAPTGDVDMLCSSLPVERLKALTEAIKSGQNAQAAFDAEVAALRKETKVEGEKEKEQAQAAAEEKKGKNALPWSEEELGLLAQGIAKFPGGTPNRWRLIADLVNQKVRKMALTCNSGGSDV